MTEDKKFNELRERVREKYARYGKLFLGPDGAELLKQLQVEFYDGDLLTDSTEKTAFNLGAREVVRFLMQMRDCAEGKANGPNQRAS